MVRKVIRKKHPSLITPKTRFWKKIQGDLTDDQMLRLVNCFVGLKRNGQLERHVIMNRPTTHKGRRHSIHVSNGANVPQAESEVEQRPRAKRDRSFSVNVPRDLALLDQNLNEIIEDEITQSAPIDEVDEGQVDEVQVGENEVDEVHESEENHELAKSPSPEQALPIDDSGFESEESIPEFQATGQLQYDDDSFFGEGFPQADGIDLSIPAPEAFFVREQQKTADAIDIDTSRETSSPRAGENAMASDELEENGDNSDCVDPHSMHPVIESDPLDLSTSEANDSSHMKVLSPDSTTVPEIEVDPNVIDLTQEDLNSSENESTEELSTSDNETSNGGKSRPLDLSLPNNDSLVVSEPMETDHSEPMEKEDDDTHQVTSSESHSHQVEEEIVRDSDEVSSDSAEVLSGVNDSSMNSTANPEFDATEAAPNDIAQMTEGMASSDNETVMNEVTDVPVAVPKEAAPLESTMQMEIDHSDGLQTDDEDTHQSQIEHVSTAGQQRIDEETVHEPADSLEVNADATIDLSDVEVLPASQTANLEQVTDTATETTPTVIETSGEAAREFAVTVSKEAVPDESMEIDHSDGMQTDDEGTHQSQIEPVPTDGQQRVKEETVHELTESLEANTDATIDSSDVEVLPASQTANLKLEVTDTATETISPMEEMTSDSNETSGESAELSKEAVPDESMVPMEIDRSEAMHHDGDDTQHDEEDPKQFQGETQHRQGEMHHNQVDSIKDSQAEEDAPNSQTKIVVIDVAASIVTHLAKPADTLMSQIKEENQTGNENNGSEHDESAVH
ncbi:dentin sialophosphoprotein-like isoform X2 [Sitodiplosis mosellana]|uniref:dentin sialophosphoprotein-like isoform X2 n=1 Tax=Sitodiplosis mosellana TaxID=263140 RepID=UPI0024446931|nr:dentin sialophosphoprotein-like isoform X2 [Sitodiplosis mosellana]